MLWTAVEGAASDRKLYLVVYFLSLGKAMLRDYGISCVISFRFGYTVDSRYLKLQGTIIFRLR